MKKMLILAAVAAAVLTACGDDDSASATPSLGCTVSSTDNSATATMSVAGYSTTKTYTVTEEGYRITFGGYGAEANEPIDMPSSTPVTKDDLVEMAQKTCAMAQ
jgi:hypothetical protein